MKALFENWFSLILFESPLFVSLQFLAERQKVKRLVEQSPQFLFSNAERQQAKGTSRVQSTARKQFQDQPYSRNSRFQD